MARVNSTPVEVKPIEPIDQVEKPVKIEAETVKKITIKNITPKPIQIKEDEKLWLPKRIP